jgi:hypothetical protein
MNIMKVKVIKKAELESMADQQENSAKAPKRRRLKHAVENWVAEIRERTEAETQVTLEHLLHPDSKPST